MGSVSSTSVSASQSTVYYTPPPRHSKHASARSKHRTPPATQSKSTTITRTVIMGAHPPGSGAEAAALVSVSIGVKEKKGRIWHRGFTRKTPVSKKRAKKSALIVRSLIVGPPSATTPKVTRAEAKPELSKVKSYLANPKTANRLIAELRTLPISDEEVQTCPGDGPGHKHAMGRCGPIRAVCLDQTDAEEDRLHFSKLTKTSAPIDQSVTAVSFTGVGSTSIEALTALMNEIHVVDLITSPDLGIGQPGDGPGLLAGALPTPETVIKGIERITPQLMALGYATGKAIVPDHKGIYPPADRMSVLTYWWGLELLLPPPSLQYLANAQSVTGAVMNFLTALSLVNNGVREILPLVRYISQYIDFEFSQIRRQDQGRGVVCAATWIMPAALVPRPWDFPDPPIPSVGPPKDKDELDNPSHRNPTNPKPAPSPVPSPSDGLPFLTPMPIHSVLDTVATTETAPATTV